MHILQALKALVNNVLLVDVLENIGPNDSLLVRVHEVKIEINIPVILSLNHILKPNDILVPIQLLQEHHLSESPLSVSRILESVKILFQRDNFLGSLINGLPDNAIRTLAQLLKNFVLLENMCFNFFGHLSN